MHKDVLLLSVHPNFASKLLDGTKKVELRRIKPNISKGSLVVIYATAPIKAIIGTVEVDEVISDVPTNLWNKVKYFAGISRAQFRSYYKGTSKGFGILCCNPRLLEQPLDLVSLRLKWENFNPPQSYRYLSLDDYKFFIRST